jgi:hypothetical protein
MAGFKNKKAKTGFNRPQATAGVVVDRVWKDVHPETLQVGDIVAGYGLVVEASGMPDCQDQVWILAGVPEAEDYFIDKDMLVKAFVRKDS